MPCDRATCLSTWGANLGAYSVLAAGVAKANVVAIEPVPTPRSRLEENLVANNIQGRVSVRGVGLGAKRGAFVFIETRTR
jgi:FkbM family methyltransferase